MYLESNSCNLSDENRRDGILCRGMHCKPCNEFRTGGKKFINGNLGTLFKDTRKKPELKEFTEIEMTFTSKSKKSNDMGRIKINCKIIDLTIPMGKIKEVNDELNDAIVETLRHLSE